jgi:prolyl 4-hydroxylase
MVYLSAKCEGGGTEFPMSEARREGRWCDFLECDNGREGVTFKPRKGAAVFWLNFDEEGRGLKETVHAGLPVTSGVKVGLNIWSWWQRGLEAEHLREEL